MGSGALSVSDGCILQPILSAQIISNRPYKRLRCETSSRFNYRHSSHKFSSKILN